MGRMCCWGRSWGWTQCCDEGRKGQGVDRDQPITEMGTMRTGMTPVVAGLILGVLASLALSRALSAQLYEVSATDPTVFTSVAALLALVSLLASGVPAMRAAKVDPTVALRS
jgi:ABC-type lipoprotein release transport system permease subunit